MRTLITGASGLLGLNMALYLANQHEVIGVVHQNVLKGVPFRVLQVDLANPQNIERLIMNTQPDVVVHCAAMANLDVCERQPELAKRVNAELPGRLAQACRAGGARLVHISTDAVFDGTKGNYRETDPVNPIGVYARYKLMGEEAVLAADPDALIARVNFYGWSLSGKRSLAEFFFNALSSGQTVRGFTDIFFCPLHVNDLIRILLILLEKNASGIYHVVSSECLSKYEFGRRLAEQFHFDSSLIQPSSWREAGLQSARSPNLTLNVDKLTALLGKVPPPQAPMMAAYYQLYLQGYPQQLASYRAET